MKFKDMSKEEKLALCEAVIDGKRVQTYSHLSKYWLDKEIDDLDFYYDGEYRIAPEKPSINWDHVAPEFKYLVLNGSGNHTICTDKPTYSDGEWWGGGRYFGVTMFASFKPGNCAPEDSLVERPE